MLFSGAELRAKLAEQDGPIDVRDQNGGPAMLGVPIALALKSIDLEKYVGVGSNARIKKLRPLTQMCELNAGSHTVVRMRDRQGVIIGAPKSGLQHKSLLRRF
jgi:hypothetical protein